MNLSQKATRFVIEALEHYRRYYDQRLQQEGLTEDDISDLENDRYYLEASRRILKRTEMHLSSSAKGPRPTVEWLLVNRRAFT
jgi:hypothetical protein